MNKEELIKKEKLGFTELVEIMKLLRAPGGCPWDREQNHKSIRNNLIEEAYELIEAIDTDNPELMKEELGDVLLQVVFHAEISDSQGDFGIDDVTDGICRKLIVRHPHVFGDVKAETSDAVLSNWDKIKRETKHQTSDTAAMRSISASLPALVRAHKLGVKGRKVGFDFDDSAEAMQKVYEEAAEASAACETGDSERIAEEFGDLLLSVVNAARLAGVDSEQALYNANEKFIKRFECVEKLCGETGKTVSETSREDKEAFWLAAKVEAEQKAVKKG